VKVSVVIPTLEEASTIAGAVASAAEDGSDVIVVDGGSRDGTPDRAAAAGARVITSDRGRARQLATGADACDRSSFALRVVEWGARLRTRLFRLPYGDQALFVRRSVLEAIGGVPQVRVMEDLDLVAAMRRTGRLVILPQTAMTSARRYVAGGVWRTMFSHWLAAAAWGLGVDRERIAGWLGR